MNSFQYTSVVTDVITCHTFIVRSNFDAGVGKMYLTVFLGSDAPASLYSLYWPDLIFRFTLRMRVCMNRLLTYSFMFEVRCAVLG